MASNKVENAAGVAMTVVTRACLITCWSVDAEAVSSAVATTIRAPHGSGRNNSTGSVEATVGPRHRKPSALVMPILLRRLERALTKPRCEISTATGLPPPRALNQTAAGERASTTGSVESVLGAGPE